MLKGNKRLKIGLLTYTVSFGGVGTFIISLAEKLKEKGFDVKVISTDKKGVWLERLKEKSIAFSHYNFGILAWIPFGRILHAIKIGRELRIQKFDIVVNNHSFFAQISAGFYKPSTTLISVLHNQHLPVIKSGCVNQEAVDAIVCVGPKVYDNAIKIVPQKKVYTILNGINLPEKNKVDNRIGIGTDFRVLYVGRLDNNQKGVLLIPEIVKKVLNNNSRVKFTIVGDGPDKDLLFNEIRSQGIADVIDYKGVLSVEEVYELYLSHHVLLLPSYFEGLPLTLMEAMGAGCVPVVTNLPGSTDVCLDDGKHGFLINVGDVNQFADKIKLLSNDWTLWEEMSLQSRFIANEKFSIDRMVNNYIQLFEELIQKSNFYRPHKINIGKSWWKEIVPFNLIMSIKKFKNRFNSF